jgi:hypothetical protein
MLRKDIDIQETYEGDLIIRGGDLSDTSHDPALTYYQIIRMCMNSKKFESAIYPDLGINLDQFEGGPNTSEIGYEAAKLIKDTIAETTVLYGPEIEVTPFPIGKYTVAFKIEISTIKSVTGIEFLIAYDTKDNKVKSLNFPDVI